jgi:opacity protein-like surface antigen
MRILIVAAALALVPLSASAQDRPSFFEGFGGLRMTSAPGTAGTLGGSIGVSVTPGIQAVGEVGRTSDVMPSSIASIIALTPAEFRVSAFYGEGGVRFLTNPHGRVSGYAETLAGFARMNASFGGVGSSRTDAIVDIALRYFDSTEPMASVGGGLIMQGGPMVATVGYRFNRIFANDALAGWISGGRLDVNEVRVGVGFRF